MFLQEKFRFEKKKVPYSGIWNLFAHTSGLCFASVSSLEGVGQQNRQLFFSKQHFSLLATILSTTQMRKLLTEWVKDHHHLEGMGGLLISEGLWTFLSVEWHEQ